MKSVIIFCALCKFMFIIDVIIHLFISRATSGLASILKDSEIKFNAEEKRLTCSILTTAEYCQETTEQVNHSCDYG